MALLSNHKPQLTFFEHQINLTEITDGRDGFVNHQDFLRG